MEKITSFTRNKQLGSLDKKPSLPNATLVLNKKDLKKELAWAIKLRSGMVYNSSFTNREFIGYRIKKAMLVGRIEYIKELLTRF